VRKVEMREAAVDILGLQPAGSGPDDGAR